MLKNELTYTTSNFSLNVVPENDFNLTGRIFTFLTFLGSG